MKNIAKKLLTLSLLTTVLAMPSAQAEEFDPMRSVADVAKSISEATNGRVNVSGYINGHYMIHDGTPKMMGKNIDKPLTQLREASLFTDIMVSDNLIFSTELETSYDFSNKASSGRDDRLKALFNYYYFDYDISSALDFDTDEYGSLSVRAGRILVPFLSYNENKPNFKQNLMSQPFTAFTIVPVNDIASSFKQFGWTDTGAILNWNRAFEDSGLLDIKITVMNGLASEGEALDDDSITLATGQAVRTRDGVGENRSKWDSFDDNNNNKAVAIKTSYALFSIPMDFGVSYYKGAWDNAGDQDLTMYGVHLNYIEKDWTIKGEYVRADVEQVAGVNPVTDPGPVALNTTTGDYNMIAWYLEGSYVPYRYGTNNDRYLRFIARYDDSDTNDKASFTPFDRSRITLGTEWGFLNNVRLRYEWQTHKLDSFQNAPASFIASGGKEDVYMHMISLIAYF